MSTSSIQVLICPLELGMGGWEREGPAMQLGKCKYALCRWMSVAMQSFAVLSYDAMLLIAQTFMH